MKTDDLYQEKKDKIESFAFNREVAEVFDDMAKRSIPCYADLQEFAAAFSLHYYRRNTYIYDLGCSTGNTIVEINKLFKEKNKMPPEIIAVDYSPEMIDIARHKSHNFNIEWTCDAVENIIFENASVVLASYVLQFIEPGKRPGIIQNIYNGLGDNGVFLLSEKVQSSYDDVESIIVDLYHEYKIRNNYTRLEIEQKAEALKDILKLMTLDDYIALLTNAGFRKIQIVFKYLQFVCLAAIK